MIGIIMSIVAGAAMSIQGVFNTRLGEKTGVYEGSAISSFIAFVCAAALMVILGKGSLAGVRDVKWIYLLGGVLGTVITVTVMLAIGNLSPVYATSIILVSQIAVSAAINGFGLFDSEKIQFTWYKAAGIAFMIAGIILTQKK